MADGGLAGFLDGQDVFGVAAPWREHHPCPRHHAEQGMINLPLNSPLTIATLGYTGDYRP